MYQDLKNIFWWPILKNNVVDFVYFCLTCQKSKIEHQESSGLMQPLSIHEWKWDSIYVYFMVGLPKITKGSDSIWIIVDRVTKSTHFIQIKIIYPL